jgi:hypothetical protein
VRAFRSDLKEVPGKPYGDEPCAAPHAGEVHAADIAAQLVLFMIMSTKDGVGQKRLQLTTTMSMLSGLINVLNLPL